MTKLKEEWKINSIVMSVFPSTKKWPLITLPECVYLYRHIYAYECVYTCV